MQLFESALFSSVLAYELLSNLYLFTADCSENSCSISKCAYVHVTYPKYPGKIDIRVLEKPSSLVTILNQTQPSFHNVLNIFWQPEEERRKS